MRTRWLGDLPDDQALDPSLRQLVGGIAKVLDRLRPPAVVAGSVFVVPDVPAVVVPHARIPGCSLVLQVSDWSSSVGCWWSERTDPRQGPPTPTAGKPAAVSGRPAGDVSRLPGLRRVTGTHCPCGRGWQRRTLSIQ
jgi:hypothetical protein